MINYILYIYINWSLLKFSNYFNYQIFYNFYGNIQPANQLNLEPTRGNNILDLLFTNCLNRVSKLEILPYLLTCDHDSVIFNISYFQKVLFKHFKQRNFKHIDRNVLNYFT